MNWELLMEDFKVHLQLERAYSKSTVYYYNLNLDKLRLFAQDKQPCTLQLSDLSDFLATISNLSVGTHCQYVATFKTFYNFLVGCGYLDASPAEQLPSPKKAQLLPKYLTIEEVMQLIRCTEFVNFPLRSKALIMTIYCCGLRISEAIGLNVEDVYTELGLLKVTGKGNKERIIPISDYAIQAIEQYKFYERVMPNRKCANRLFTVSTGNCFQKEYIWTLFKNLCTLANIEKDVSPHALRHSFATHLKSNGASLIELQKLLGHESIVDTQRYAHVDFKDLRAAIAKHPSNQ